jgi:serine/threonine protein kinase
MADRIGQQLGNYRLIRLIGQGGFADVFLGEHVYLKTQVAVKLLQTRVADDELEGFLKEARTIAHLVHPHIVRVMDFGVERETPFLVMDYAPNGTLRQLHPRGTQLLSATIVPYVKQVADALQYAHDEKFIHRDIKPENILLGRRNEVLLSDFGIAQIAQSTRYQNTREVAGTVFYMAPEQIQGKPRAASDQYALGVVVYEWLSGDRPFNGSFTEVCAQHIFASPPSLREKISTLSPAVEEVVLTALAKDPSQRFKSVQAFAKALEQASHLERSTGLAIPLNSQTSSAVPVKEIPGNLPLPSPSSPQALPPSPTLEPERVSSPPPIPIQSVDIAASPRADPAPSETSPQFDVGPSTVAVEPSMEVSEGHRAVAGKRNGKMKMWLVWGIGKRQVLAMLLGVILYSAVNYPLNFLYSQDSSLVVTSISIFNVSIDSGIVIFMSVVLVIPLFMGTVFGPWVGLITVMVGAYLSALLASYNFPSDYYGVSWTWSAGQLLIGFIAGLALLKTQGRYNTGSAIAYAVAISAAGILVGIAFTTFGDIWVSSITLDVAWSIFLSLALPAAINLLLLPLLLLAYNTATERLRGVQFNKRT